MNHREPTIAQLETAVEHRTTIGIALGILMERHGLTEEAAFAFLRRESSTRERKVYDLAVELRSTGRLAGR